MTATTPAPVPGFEERTEWVMGTALRVVLPADRADRDTLFRACFAAARRWDALLSPWQAAAPLSRLSAGAGRWVTVPPELLAYLERAARDAERTGHVFDITLAWRGSRAIAIDRAAGRARLPAQTGPLDPGADGKGVALDAMAAILDGAGVRHALVDFGTSSYLARGDGPGGDGWDLALTGPDGGWLGVLRLRDAALSVSCTVQRDRREDGTVAERHHLRDLRRGETVRARRTVAVVAGSATEAEVLSTVVAVIGAPGLRNEAGRQLRRRFPGCTLGIFAADASPSWLDAGFADLLRRPPSGSGP